MMLKKISVESGRSLTEMLGVLAVMGIIILTAVKMFHSAMDRHQANELINEANKRATFVATQIMAGKDKNALSVAEFSNPVGYTFGVDPNPVNAEQFDITLNGVSTNVCSKMKNMVGPVTTMRAVSAECDRITYNDDLSRDAYASDYNANQSACTGAGYKWCPYGDNGVGSKCIPKSETCCTNISYDTQCQMCNETSGTVYDKSNTTSCDFDGDGENDSFCNSGICPKSGITTDTDCTTNEQCGGPNSGWYCAIAYNASNNRNETQTIANANCYRNLVGKCKVMTWGRKLTASEKAILKRAFSPTFLVGPGMNWWSGNNWCLAQGKQMMNAIDLDCYNSGTSTPKTGGMCCKEGAVCQASNWDTLWSGKKIKSGQAEEVAKFSDKFVALRKVYGGGSFHTATPHASTGDNSCNVQTVYTVRGDIYGGNGRPVSLSILCQ